MFADIAAPETDDSAVTAAADNATRTRHVDHCVTAPRPALPSAARHAEDVCTNGMATAERHIDLTSLTTSKRSPPLSDEKMTLTAKGENAKSAIADGIASASVKSSDFVTRLRASSASPRPPARATRGTAAAARPYAAEAGRLMSVTAQPEKTPQSAVASCEAARRRATTTTLSASWLKGCAIADRASGAVFFNMHG